MSEDQQWTLQRLFFGRVVGEGEARRKLESDPAMEELQKEMAGKLGRVPWKAIAKEMAKQIGKVLDIGIADHVLAPVWGKMEGLQEYLDKEQHPANESSLVPLVDHSVSSAHAPHIDLLLKGVEIGRLELKVDVGLALEGVNLRVEDGRIWQVQAGKCSGSGTLECVFRGKSVYKIERESRSFNLKNGLSFAEGLPIPALT